MFKKVISLSLVVAIIMSMNVVVFANDTEENISSFTTKNISDIPVYITYMNSTSEKEIDRIKEEANGHVSNDSTNLTVQRAMNNKIYEQVGRYEIVKISTMERNALSNSILLDTYNRVEELIADGVKVNYINVFMPSSSKNSTRANDPDDPAYWEETCVKLGNYDGYTFLYLESSIGIETNFVKAKNLSGSLKWSKILGYGIKTVIDRTIKDSFYDVANLIYTTISTITSSYNAPIRTYYEPSSEYIKSKVSGDLYSRTVLIRDLDNRIDGYAYYNWASTQKLISTVRVDMKYAVSQNPGGTYKYDYPVGKFKDTSVETPGYDGNSTFYKKLIDLYENNCGYFTHNENLDINSIVTELLTN